MAWLGGALFALLLAEALPALARPGGGHTFGSGGSGGSHGGGGHGGGGGGGDGGELVFFLIRLLFYYPKLGLVVIVIAAIVWFRFRNAHPESWVSASPHARPAAEAPAGAPSWASLRLLDPEFSRVILEDFAFRLYAAAHRARRDESALAGLAPYLSEEVRRALFAEPPSELPVSNVVVGSLQARLLSVPVQGGAEPEGAPSARVRLLLLYEANLTFGAPPRERTLYQRERWTLERDASARTKPPEETERLGCPSCGAPFSASDGRRCAYCGQVVVDGRFAWQVVGRQVLAREARPPALTSSVEERGTDRPTVVDPECEVAWSRLTARDPALTAAALDARTGLIYAQLNDAWTRCELTTVRGLLSDGMFDYLRYWTEAYRAQKLRNVLEHMEITRIVRAKVVSDRHFDAVTLRLWARGADYTVDAGTGAVISGSRSTPRAYSEYWTLIRGAATSGAPRADASCPSCGAPLSISMAGACAHCGSHVTRGEFDWVLSKIEQDDVYEG